MMRHVIRMGPTWLRRPLLVIVWPWAVLKALVIAGIGPSRWVLLEPSFYAAAVEVFVAAWRGEFVPK
jgi:hypothetical protein